MQTEVAQPMETMTTERTARTFSEEYGRMRTLSACVRETSAAVPEHVVQCIWYDQLFSDEGLCTDQGQALKVLSPGWWNHEAGPDFRGAQLSFNGNVRTGDVEVHLDAGAWRQHGHHQDARYDEVLLEVVLGAESRPNVTETSKGRRVPRLLLGRYLSEDIRAIADRLDLDDYPYQASQVQGRCAVVAQAGDGARLERLLGLAGEWRMLNKARAVRERADRAGADQAAYESLMESCGYSHFKHHFRVVSRQFPYDRARQLALQDPLILETALLQIAGLLPEVLAESPPHFTRLDALRREHLPGLRSLPMTWRRVGVRPTNYPERRLAGATRFIARTAAKGLAESLDAIWETDLSPTARRRAFESLFPGAMGFWADHCTWMGKALDRAAAPLGSGRIRSIIGNVFVPLGLASARQHRDRTKEERVLEFFEALPKEADNHILKRMVPRMYGEEPPRRLTFRTQQGLLQIYQDWCQSNPSCHACGIARHLDA